MKRTAVIGLALWTCATMPTGCGTPGTAELVKAGVSEFQLGRLDAAREILARALTQSPSHPTALFYMGRISHTEKFYEQAIYYYRCCLDADPGYPQAAELLVQAQRQADTRGAAPPSPEISD